MSKRNGEVARRHIELFNEGDIDGLMALFTDDGVVETDPRFPEGGIFEGRGPLRRMYEGLHEGWESGSSVEILGLTEAPADAVLVDMIWRGTGETSGIDTHLELSGVWWVRGGRIARLQYFFERDEALAAAGLER